MLFDVECAYMLHKVVVAGDAAAAASSGRVSKYHFTEQENCWKQFLLKLFEVHYDYTSI